MSRRLWRCRHAACPIPHGAALGHLTAARDLVLAADVTVFQVHLDTRRAMVVCPRCGAAREFRSGSVFSAPARIGNARGEPAAVDLVESG
ncbi:MAG: hypothetical protein ACRDJW_22850 [Thermomicrobiales bacterium]